jgi:hypothetical protein
MLELTDETLDDVIEAVENACAEYVNAPDDLIHAELAFLKELRELRRKKSKRR